MVTFSQAVKGNANNKARTANNMKALHKSQNPCVDLFFKIGASRGKDITPEFVAAYQANKDVALRIALWARDIRGGAGERQIFRDIMVWLEKNDPDAAILMLKKVPELGRFDDLLVFNDKQLKEAAFTQIRDAIINGNALAAKWMPRKGQLAAELRTFFGWTPKRYRKTLVELTKVVETQMCAKQWDEINFSHVPSVAASRYKKAFYRHTPKYAEYVAKLVKGDKTVKINASSIFPHDVLKGRISSYSRMNWTKTELDAIEAQWNALPNYINDGNVLPLVDVSGSMTCRVGGNPNLTCLDVAVSLGLYCADKNTGKFKDTFLTFSSDPQLLHLTGGINKKIDQMVQSHWQMSTDLHKAMKKILDVATQSGVSQEEMPETLLILSDMQFNQCFHYDDSAMEMIRRKYEAAGYNVPKIVWWNLNAHDNTPVRFDERGSALVSGFSPSLLKSVLGNDIEDYTPENVMLKTIMVERYAI